MTATRWRRCRRPTPAVDVPCWRHAIINFPHPLLQQGLVILDTPGLNAIGTEPELTLNLLPNAHAILFILAADAGVTKTDIDVWTKHLVGDSPASREGRLVILNKIDGLWDELRTAHEIEGEIARQVRTSAQLLMIPPAQVFPVSAQKALLAKVNGDDVLLARSRLPQLEAALSQGADSGQAAHRRLGDADRDPRARRGHAHDTRQPHRRHTRAADRAAEPARKEPGCGRAHDGAHPAGKEPVRARHAALHGAAHGIHAADQQPVRKHRAGDAARHGRRHARADREEPVHQGRALRDGRFLRQDLRQPRRRARGRPPRRTR